MNYVGGDCVVLDLTGGNLGAWGRCNVEQRGTTWDDWGRQFTGSTLAGELCKLLNALKAKKTSKK